ncbi:hypothetical protein [Pseudoalteromonas sp.]|uniref:hypothetical protein n=1 Tax=Pseudoalteromonas sp. TaxID=53249 RepID=UPI00262A5093|nr:hypothetical protein [Pseudoalteromonas sp.]MCP4589035.1 hypothetical protein [Pseudoalteromonas sp.]
MKADLTNINHYPVEKLLITLRNHDELIFSGKEFDSRSLGVKEYKINSKFILEQCDIDCSMEDEYSIEEFCAILLDRLVREDLIAEWTTISKVEFEDENGEISTAPMSHRAYTLTLKGLDIVLKVEAHEDAERRHQDTNEHNVLMRQIGVSSFLISFAAVCVSGYLAYLANKNIELNQKRLELYQQQIESLKDKVDDKQIIFTDKIKKLVDEAIEQKQQKDTSSLDNESQIHSENEKTKPLNQSKNPS